MEDATQAQDGRQPQQGQTDPQQGASARVALVDSVAKATGLDRARRAGQLRCRGGGVTSICNADI